MKSLLGIETTKTGKIVTSAAGSSKIMKSLLGIETRQRPGITYRQLLFQNHEIPTRD